MIHKNSRPQIPSTIPPVFSCYSTNLTSFNANCFSFSCNFAFKSIICCAFSPFRLCNSVSSSCCTNNFCSKCCIFSCSFVSVALPTPTPCPFSTRNFSICTDRCKLSLRNAFAASNNLLSITRNQNIQQWLRLCSLNVNGYGLCAINSSKRCVWTLLRSWSWFRMFSLQFDGARVFVAILVASQN